jgi:preprotein translocase subunit SecA
MIGSIFKGITKIFGSKSDRDLKELNPVVGLVNEAFAKLQSLSDDDLRNKTQQLKDQIKERLAVIDQEIEELKLESQVADIDLIDKDNLFKRIDQLKKNRDTELELVLNDILPDAFAVVKETARRFAENKQLVVKATDWDKEMSARTKVKKPVTIDGEKAIWGTWFITMCS